MDIIEKYSVGIIEAILSDPLSEMLTKINKLDTDGINAVGFYYSTTVYNENKKIITLFNVYDNSVVSWIKLDMSLEDLLKSPFVKKIIFYPITTNTVLTLDYITSCIIDVIHENNDMNRINGYYNLLYSFLDMKHEMIVTGYYIANKLLLKLSGIKNSTLIKTSTSILPCPIIEDEIILIPEEINLSTDDIDRILEETKEEIVKLTSIFITLYTNDQNFKSSIMKLKECSVIDLDDLFNKELNFVSYIIGSLKQGAINRSVLNEHISELRKERALFGNKVPLPRCQVIAKSIDLSDADLSFCYKLSDTLENSETVKTLGSYLEHICEQFTKDDHLIVDLGKIVNLYNNIFKGTEIKQIIIPYTGGNSTVSRGCSLVLPNQLNTKMPSTIVSMYNNNFTSFTDTQLIDMLVYIDSLRHDDMQNMKFVGLENEIINELSRRKTK